MPMNTVNNITEKSLISGIKHSKTFFSSIDLKTFEFKKFAEAEGSNGIGIGRHIKK